MSHVQSPVAPTLPRIGVRGDGMARVKPVSFRPAPRQAGPGFSLRGNLLYPALLTVLAAAAYLVGGKKDELR